MSLLKADTIKPVTSSGDLSLQGDSGGSAVDCLNITSAGDINFTGNTDAKIKLPSAGGIYESDGSTAILTESGGAVTLDNVTLGSSVGAGIVKYTNQTKVTATGASATPTVYTLIPGMTITVPSASAALGTKIEIAFSNNFWIDFNNTAASRSLIDLKLVRTAPSVVDIFVGEMMGQYALNFNIALLVSGTVQDVSLGSGDHTYQLQYRKAGGDANAASNIYYLGNSSASTSTIIAKVI